MKFFLYLIIFVTSFSNFAQIEKIEPPFWWEGIQESKIQLMLYGKNLSQYDLELDSSKRIDVSRVENPNYLFVDLDISEHIAGKLKFNLIKQGKIFSSFNFEIKNRERRENIPSFNSSDVIFPMMQTLRL